MKEREQHILKVLIEKYLSEGQPVGSKILAENPTVGLSSASIRNVMAELEEMGLLFSPHTSAGRVPTQQGLRFFVDSLLTTKPLLPAQLEDVKAQLTPDQDPRELIQSASSLLSGITQLAGIVTLPKLEPQRLRHVEFLPLSEQRVLVILVFDEQDVQNRIIHTERDYAAFELQQIANFFNAHFSGQELTAIRHNLLDAMAADKSNLDSLMQTVLEVAEKALDEDTNAATEDVVVAGQNHLLDYVQDGEMLQLRGLFDAFAQKQTLLHLLDKSVQAEGIQIYIGEESGYGVFDDCSVVTAPYHVDDDVVGVLGVIGPTRMGYERIIPAVDVTAKLLGSALRARKKSP
ncbi:MAG: heat-inducible transcription repressor HrcA [Legionellales bacterium]|nr:heat-inducible transcription repressor HrcA [Legionellales bacterium]|tara:strand:- start:11006 stop:12046 length:1041 start_codon:yes stop_codon:yes gene_type:complete